MSQICRICLSDVGNTNKISSEVIELIEILVERKIDVNISPCESICSICVHSVQIFLRFKELCVHGDAVWSEYYQQRHDDGDTHIKSFFKPHRQRLKEKYKISHQNKAISSFFDDFIDSNEAQTFSKGDEETILQREEISKSNESVTISNKINEHVSNLNEIFTDENSAIIAVNSVTLSTFAETQQKKRKFLKINNTEGLEITLSVEEQKDEMKRRSQNPKFIRAEFKCDSCICVFNNERTLQSHLDKHNEDRGSEFCGICLVRFDTARQLAQHARLHSFRIECQVCGGRMRDRTSFTEHMDLHKGKTFPCSQCDQIFSVRTVLKTHIFQVHDNREYPCDYCSMTFKFKTALKKHIRIHNKGIQHRCKHCPETFPIKYYLRKHVREKHDGLSQDNYCVECDAIFSDASALKTHFRTTSKHRDPKKLIYPCSRCKKRFETEEALALHIDSFHERLSRYSCEICGRGYASLMGLSHHTKREHHGYRPPLKHTCDNCGKSFSAKAILVNHIRTHTGEKPFQCDTCKKKFTQKSALATHIKLVHFHIKRKLNKRKLSANMVDAPGKEDTMIADNTDSVICRNVITETRAIAFDQVSVACDVISSEEHSSYFR